MDLVLFDLDNTLLSGDSDFEWGQFLVEVGVLDKEVYEAKNVAFYEQYKAGTLDINEFLDFQLKPLSRHPRGQLEMWRQQFIKNRIMPLISEKAKAAVASHGDSLIAIITATNSFVTRPIADMFGINHLIATEPEIQNGQFTGKVSDVPCFREGKITRLMAWLSKQGKAFDSFERSYFYSDSLNDLPLLTKVKYPIAVDPDPTLRAHAEKNSWPVISLR